MPKYKMFKNLFFLLICSIAIIMSSCKSNNKNNAESQEVNIEDFVSEDDIFDDIDKAKKIFYSLPSPLETAMIIKTSGATYDESILNPLDNQSKYTTNKAMALNLGIYTTDLSFASLFDQTQTSINYMTAAKTMAEGLDISGAINDETFDKLEANLQNRDVVMDIISETFLNSSSYLKENEREDVAAIVLVGGWVEGLYLAAEIIGDSVSGNELVNRVNEQKLSLNIVMRMLEDNKENAKGEENEDIVELIEQLQPLKKAFDKIKIEISETKPVTDLEKNVTTLESETKVTFNHKDFKEIQRIVKELRTIFIQ